MRVAFLIDGFNLYHSLRDAEAQGGSVKWLDLTAFCTSFLPQLGSGARLGSIKYFTALATHLQHRDPQRVGRHQRYIQCLKDSGVEVVMGAFKRKKVYCPRCGQYHWAHEEKETDVAIAGHLLEILIHGDSDATFLVTGDTDLAAAVRVARSIFATHRYGFIFPFNRKNRELEQLVGKGNVFKASAQLYRQSQFADPYITRAGQEIYRPQSW